MPSVPKEKLSRLVNRWETLQAQLPAEPIRSLCQTFQGICRTRSSCRLDKALHRPNESEIIFAQILKTLLGEIQIWPNCP